MSVKNENDFKYGIYHHYKGGMYRALHLGALSERRDITVVVYVSLTPGPNGSVGNIWVRPFKKALLESDDCWTDTVKWPDGVKRQRFVHADDITTTELEQLDMVWRSKTEVEVG